MFGAIGEEKFIFLLLKNHTDYDKRLPFFLPTATGCVP